MKVYTQDDKPRIINGKIIDNLILKAENNWKINSAFMRDAKKNNPTEAHVYAKQIVRYIKIIDRLKKSRANYE